MPAKKKKVSKKKSKISKKKIEANIKEAPKKMEDILSSTHADMEHAKNHIWLEGALMSLPLVVSFWFYTGTILRTSSQLSTDELLSPPQNSETLLLFVLMFIIVYSLFLIHEYRKLYKKYKSLSVQSKK